MTRLAHGKIPRMCGHCKRRKRCYDTRVDAKRALRTLYPNAVGTMNVYRCRAAPPQSAPYHIGHREYAPETALPLPEWTDAAIAQPCEECAEPIAEGEALAWSAGRALCLECGSDVETAWHDGHAEAVNE